MTDNELRLLIIEYLNRCMVLNEEPFISDCKIDYFELLDELSLIYYENFKDTKIVVPNIFNTLKSIKVQNAQFLSFGDLVHKVGYSSLKDNYKLKEVEFEGDIILGESAFSNCIYLTSLKARSIQQIDKCCFYSCYRLKYIDLKNTVTISPSAFYNCYALEEADLSKCYVSESSFVNCNSLKKVILNKKYSNDIDIIFKNCINLKEIVYV